MTGYQSKRAAAQAIDKVNWADHEPDGRRAAAQDKLGAAPDNIYTIKLPERSEWKCYMFGNTPHDNQGIVYIPGKGKEPNWFVRWMMKICFDCLWVKGALK